MSGNIPLAEATQKNRAFAGLAKHYSTEASSWLAVHAQVQSDIYAAYAVLLEAGQSMDGVSDRIAERMERLPIRGGSTPYQAAQEARNTIGESLSDDLLTTWLQRLQGIKYLDEMPYLPENGLPETVQAWLGDADQTEYIESCRAEQSEQWAAAAAARIALDSWAEIEAMYAADMAAFRGWLVRRSVNLKDDSLTFCDMTWVLAAKSLESIEEFPEVPQDALRVVRSRLAWAVHPIERANLASAVEHGL